LDFDDTDDLFDSKPKEKAAEKPKAGHPHHNNTNTKHPRTYREMRDER